MATANEILQDIQAAVDALPLALVPRNVTHMAIGSRSTWGTLGAEYTHGSIHRGDGEYDGAIIRVWHSPWMDGDRVCVAKIGAELTHSHWNKPL